MYIGIDAVKNMPQGANAFTHTNLMLNLFTKGVSLHPVNRCTAFNLANCIWCNYGNTDRATSGQGHELTSTLFTLLTSHMGRRHTFSIAGNQANGAMSIVSESD
jgi:hypothetical protein